MLESPRLSEASLVLAEGLWRTFTSGAETVHAVRGATLQLRSGEVALIQGKSGSGKTTFLNLVGGLDVPTAGRVLYKGRDVVAFSQRERTLWHRSEVGFVFQAFALVPGLTACENVDLPLRIAGIPPDAATTRALRALERVGLGNRAHHRTEELSGGEQQRVAIARGTVTEPRLLLAAEPTDEHPAQCKSFPARAGPGHGAAHDGPVSRSRTVHGGDHLPDEPRSLGG